jgi:feruloyl esterase
MAQCDKQDGVADGVLENPAACRFDPKTVQCKTGDAADCLTPAQIAALRRIYSGPTTRGGRSLYPGFPVGGEAVPGAWDSWIVKPDGQHAKFSTEFFRNMVFDDVSWNPATFDAERDLKSARARQGGTLDSDNADLSAFKARGGKLILYHGWADAAIPAGSTIEYYKALEARTGGDFVRMFLMPGMSHCLGGPGPNVFDALGTLDAWRGGGPAPEQMIATKFDNDLFGFLGFPAKPVRTRPICAWPKTARWDGKGSTDEAASFACVTENSVSRRP